MAHLVYLSRLLLIVFESRPLPFLGTLKRKCRPCLLPPIPFLNSPREKKQNGNGAAGAEGGNAELAEAWGGIQCLHLLESDHSRTKPPRARSARSGVGAKIGSSKGKQLTARC